MLRATSRQIGDSAGHLLVALDAAPLPVDVLVVSTGSFGAECENHNDVPASLFDAMKDDYKAALGVFETIWDKNSTVGDIRA